MITNLDLPGALANYSEYFGNSNHYRKKVIWVGNATGLPAGSGIDADHPKSALFGTGGALAAAHATLGTRIYVLEGHSENVSAADAASATGSATNIEIIGCGVGTDRPLFTWTAAASTWLIDTAKITIANCRLKFAGAAATPALTVTTALVVSAASFQLIKNDIEVGIDADTLCTDGITTSSGATDMKIVGNNIHGGILSEVLSVLTTTGATNRLLIKDNIVVATASTASTGALLDLSNAAIVDNDILNNRIHNTKASSKFVIRPHATSTGIVDGNRYYTGDGGTTPATSAWTTFTTDYKHTENYCVTAVGVSGLLCPAADA